MSNKNPSSPRPSPPKGGEGEPAGAAFVSSLPRRGGEGQGEVGARRDTLTLAIAPLSHP